MAYGKFAKKFEKDMCSILNFYNTAYFFCKLECRFKIFDTSNIYNCKITMYLHSPYIEQFNI